MARLPSERYLMQQIESDVVLFEDMTERELVRYPVGDRDLTAKAQHSISQLDELSPEDRSFAHFWSGYFYAHGGE